MTLFFVGAYAFAALVTGMLAFISDDLYFNPQGRALSGDERAALIVIGSALWPIVVLCAMGFGLVRVGGVLGRGTAGLARRVSRRLRGLDRVGLPVARARSRQRGSAARLALAAIAVNGLAVAIGLGIVSACRRWPPEPDPASATAPPPPDPTAGCLTYRANGTATAQRLSFCSDGRVCVGSVYGAECVQFSRPPAPACPVVDHRCADLIRSGAAPAEAEAQP